MTCHYWRRTRWTGSSPPVCERPPVFINTRSSRVCEEWSARHKTPEPTGEINWPAATHGARQANFLGHCGCIHSATGNSEMFTVAYLCFISLLDQIPQLKVSVKSNFVEQW